MPHVSVFCDDVETFSYAAHRFCGFDYDVGREQVQYPFCYAVSVAVLVVRSPANASRPYRSSSSPRMQLSCHEAMNLL
jgi:hypothetical protein